MLESLPKKQQTSLHDLYPNASADSLSLMAAMLQFNPEKRINAEEALESAYVCQFHDPNNEPDAPGPIALSIDDNVKFSISEYRESLYNEVARRRKEERKSK